MILSKPIKSKRNISLQYILSTLFQINKILINLNFLYAFPDIDTLKPS